MDTRLRWSGSNEAQRQADEAFARLKAWQPKKPGKRTSKRRKASTFVGTYADYLRSPQWRKKRAKALRAHGSRCAICGTVERLEVHHLHYRTLFRESARDDLRILCRECHAVEHEAKGAIDSLTAEFVAIVRG